MIEPVRQWYRRTTRAALMGLVWAAIAAVVFSVAAFVFMPQDMVIKVQCFNGAFTVPIFGGIWIASFIFLWLNPSREVMFRSQESMERMESSFNQRLERIDRIIGYCEKAVDDDVLGKIESNMDRIRIRIEKNTETLPSVPRRPEEILADPDIPARGHTYGANGNGD